MFPSRSRELRHIARRLTILSVLLVVATIIVIGLGTWLLVRHQLGAQLTEALTEQIELERERFETDGPREQDNPGTYSDGDDDDDEGHEVLERGDTQLFVFNTDGTLTFDMNNIAIAGLPVTEAVDTALAGETDTRTVRIQEVDVRVRTEPVVRDGQVVGAIQAARSESDAKTTLRLLWETSVLGMLGGSLIAAVAGLLLASRALAPIEEGMERQRRFIADAAHELRTPISILRSHTELIDRYPPDSIENLRIETQQLLREIDGLTDLTRSLLDLARLEADRPSTFEPIVWGDLLTHIVDTIRPAATRHGVDVDVDVDVHLTSSADRSVVDQILRIFLDNAIAFSLEGSTVTVAARRLPQGLVVSVVDQGVGIAQSDLPFVFDRFWQADASRNRGVGLGLSIARTLADRAGGTVALSSVAGQGTTASLTIPDLPVS